MRLHTLAALVAALLSLWPLASTQAQEGVTVTAAPQFTSVTPGQNLAVAVTFDFAKNLHIWPNVPEVPDGVEGLSPFPTTISLAEGATLPKGVKVLLDRVQWAKPERVEVLAGTTRLTILAYHHRTTIFVPVSVEAGAQAGPFTIPLVASFQACDEKSCLQPEDREIPVDLLIGATVVPGDAALFDAFDAGAFAAAAAPPPSPAAPTPIGEPAKATPDDQWIDIGIASLRIPKGGLLGYTLLFLVAFVGGFILNLTPCVLPVIPLKILGLQAQAGSRSRMLYLGFVMFCGLVFFWLVIGALIAFGVLGAVSQISSYWQFNLAIAAFMAVMGLGMLGLFTVGLPTWVYNIDVKHDSVKGSFGFGIMTAVLATPCVAPLAGGAMAAATKFPAPIALLIFAFIGIGMGVPYVVLAAYPRLVSWIPRAGPGSELLKQVLGILLVAISLFFLGTSLITLSANYPYIAKQLHWWAIAIAILFACTWLVLRSWQISRSAGARAAVTFLAGLFAITGFWWANVQTTQAKTEWTRAEAARVKALASQTNDPNANLLWQDYTAAKADQFIADGKVVVMDFTADWCLICKTLEATVLHTTGVEAALAADHVRSFKVDLTSNRAPGWQRLAALDQKGVPTLAIYGPGLERPWVRNAYSISEVIEAIAAARGTPKPPQPQATR